MGKNPNFAYTVGLRTLCKTTCVLHPKSNLKD